MEELLPYYERELGFLRRYAREFAERYPKIAGRLLIAGEVCEDPNIERMIESFALLNARISKRLDDDYPEFTEALFEVLYPHYLRPFPSCSIISVAFTNNIQLTDCGVIPRGTALASDLALGPVCAFRTAYPVTVAPLLLTQVSFAAIATAPAAVRLPPSAGASISIGLRCINTNLRLPVLGLRSLRLFIDGEPSFSAALRDALLTRCVQAYVEVDGNGRWSTLPAVPLAEAGFGEDEALIPFPARSHPAYRLLTEYFCFPEKFNFFDLDMAAIGTVLPDTCAEFTLHLALSGLRSDSDTARLLSTLSTNNLRLGCTPVVNLFDSPASAIALTQTSASYPLRLDNRPSSSYDIYAVESLTQLRESPGGAKLVEFQPFYSLRHGQRAEQHGHYWTLRRNEVLAQQSDLHSAEIAIVDIDFDPAATERSTLSLMLSCTNSDLPAAMTYGAQGGDMPILQGATTHRATLLRKPTLSQHFQRGRGAHWRLISHLSLNHLSLSGGGLEAFREMLTLYDLPRLPASQRQIGGLVAIEHRAVNTWLPGNPFACLVRGVEVRLTIDEEAFVGSGIHAFTHLVERFLGLYVHANSFTQLVVVAKKTGEELVRCKPRSGDLNLV